MEEGKPLTMQSICKSFSLLFLFLIIVKISLAQEIFPSKNIGLTLKGAFLEEDPLYFGVELEHEWRLLEFVGFGVGGGIESSNNYTSYTIISKSFQGDNIDYYDLKGSCSFANAKITGYLPILYNDDDRTDIQFYATFFSGVASLRLSGQIDLVSPDNQLINKADERTQLFYGFDFGVIGTFSDRFAMRIFIGGNSINFRKTSDIINEQIPNQPFHYGNIENEPYVGIGLIYTYKRFDK